MHPALNPLIKDVRCSLSGQTQAFDFTPPLGLCRCCTPAKPVMIHYRAEQLRPGWVKQDETSLWRYRALLPIARAPEHYFYSVGSTPTFRDPRLSERLGVEVFIKGEHTNLSGSFKDRGLSVAVLLATSLGANRFCLPTQGNAGVAAALFCSRLNLAPCKVWMPETCRGGVYHRRAAWHGAEVKFAGRNIADAGAVMRESCAEALQSGELVDLSTFYEPGRLEGKKTLGFEIAEAFGADLPEAILYPTGGGTGLVGIWKAFGELQQTGDLNPRGALPRMFAIQSENCAPVVEAFKNNFDHVVKVESKGTLADGLDVPAAIMGHEILRILRASKGDAVSVSETAIAGDFKDLGRLGMTGGYESAATVSGLRRALREGRIERKSRVLLIFTSGAEAALARQS
ncbi:MAG: hypothetical protein RJA70_3807 [Pseudomonadota bacterium]